MDNLLTRASVNDSLYRTYVTQRSRGLLKAKKKHTSLYLSTFHYCVGKQFLNALSDGGTRKNLCESIISSSRSLGYCCHHVVYHVIVYCHHSPRYLRVANSALWSTEGNEELPFLSAMVLKGKGCLSGCFVENSSKGKKKSKSYQHMFRFKSWLLCGSRKNSLFTVN